MKRIITAAMMLVLSLVLFTACASKGPEKETGAEGTSKNSGQEGAVGKAEEEAPAEAAQPTGEAGANEEAVRGLTYPYTYIDAAGREVVLEQEPARIAVNYLPLWETLLMLDVMPIAASGAQNYIATWDAFAGYELSSIQDIGTSEVNLELLTELQPDIILDQAFDVSNLDIVHLEKIAPVAVFGNDTKMDWRLSLREVARIVNKEAKAEEVIAEVDAKLALARTKLEENYSGDTVMQISMMGEDKYYCTYRPDLYDDSMGLGLNLPEGYTTALTYEQISMEAIVEMNPDYIFMNVFDGDEALFEALQENTVWKSLKAVRNGHVYRLDGGGHACSPLATVYTVNFITDAMLGE